MRSPQSEDDAKAPGQLALEQEAQIQHHRARYKEVMQAFLNDPNPDATALRSRLQEIHGAGVDYFNAFERSIPTSSLLRADDDPAWYSGKGETAANVLGTIVLHFRTVKQKAEQATLSSSDFWPSPTAYAAMQRIVRHVVPEQADNLRGQFASLGLPTYGFDHAEMEKPRMPTWQKIIGVCFGIVFVIVLLCLALWVPKPTSFQVFVFRAVLALAAGACATMLTGFLNVEGRGKRWTIRAGAGLAVFVIVYMMNPPALV